MTKIAFYAPVKPPDHPIPSGDRLIAQNTLQALSLAGFETEIASRHIAYSKRPGLEYLQARRDDALAEADRLVAQWRNAPPELFLTYHPYCKAPDWIGPTVSEQLGLPYVTMEAAHTGQGFENGGDVWRNWREEAHKGFRKANLHLCLKPSDKAYLLDKLGPNTPVSDFPIFIDRLVQDLPPPPQVLPQREESSPWLVTAAMMRPGKKTRNFQLLAEALLPLQDIAWTLTIIGDGPQRADIEKLFARFDARRIWFAGELDHPSVLASFKTSDVFVWPGWKEPIGMVYLEAQMMGLPVAAFCDMGVPLVVNDGISGLLAKPGDTAELGSAIRRLLIDKDLRTKMSASAKHHVEQDHSINRAADELDRILTSVIKSHQQTKKRDDR